MTGSLKVKKDRYRVRVRLCVEPAAAFWGQRLCSTRLRPPDDSPDLRSRTSLPDRFGNFREENGWRPLLS